MGVGLAAADDIETARSIAKQAAAHVKPVMTDS
jgi:formate-dependent phosphoribosylglycinamide formyltransferase (GAR transformylase)